MSVCAAVEALARSDYGGEVEAVVVVDGSTDGTAHALAALELPFAVTVIEQPNRGAAAARNRAAAEASNVVLLFLDDDMLCAPDMIAEHARFHSAGAHAVVGDARRDPGSPPGFMSDTNEMWLKRAGGPLTLFDVWTGQLSIRRSVFEEIGGFDEAYTDEGAFANEDADLGIRLLADYDVRHNPAAISYQRYVVSPRELIRRAPLRAAGDIRLARKHPEVARGLFRGAPPVALVDAVGFRPAVSRSAACVALGRRRHPRRRAGSEDAIAFKPDAVAILPRRKSDGLLGRAAPPWLVSLVGSPSRARLSRDRGLGRRSGASPLCRAAPALR